MGNFVTSAQYMIEQTASCITYNLIFSTISPKESRKPRSSPSVSNSATNLQRYESNATRKSIWCVNEAEAEFLCKQIYDKKEYDDHAIDLNLRENAVIVDIGSNIGLFSLYASDVTNQSANIIAIEPVPCMATATRRNLSTQHDSDKFEVHQCAIGDTGDLIERRISFKYYPKYSLLSGIADSSHTLTFNEKMNIVLYCLHCNAWYKRVHCAVQNIPILARLVQFVCSSLLYTMLDSHYLKAEQFECELYSLDEVLEVSDFELDRIDLVKVDVEKAELQVLEGIGDATWRKIQQIVIEVHDIDGRIETVRQMLTERGFKKIFVTEKMPPKFYGFVVNGTADGDSTDKDRTELVANIYARR